MLRPTASQEPENGAMIRGLHHVSRTVADMDKSIHFYRDLLGLPILLDEELAGKELERVVGLENVRLRIVELGLAGGHLLELIQYHSPRGRTVAGGIPADVGAHHVAFAVPDVHSVYAQLSGAGVRFTCAPVQVSAGFFKGVWTTYCFDPDGLVVELWQPVSG